MAAAQKGLAFTPSAFGDVDEMFLRDRSGGEAVRSADLEGLTGTFPCYPNGMYQLYTSAKLRVGRTRPGSSDRHFQHPHRTCPFKVIPGLPGGEKLDRARGSSL